MLKFENSKLFQKSMNDSNWRKNRHEREQFVNSKRVGLFSLVNFP